MNDDDNTLTFGIEWDQGDDFGERGGWIERPKLVELLRRALQLAESESVWSIHLYVSDGDEYGKRLELSFERDDGEGREHFSFEKEKAK